MRDSASGPADPPRNGWLGEFADLEDLGPAVGADPFDGGATVFHGHLFGVFDLDLLALFDAVTLWHEPSLRALTARTVGPLSDGWPSTVWHLLLATAYWMPISLLSPTMNR